MGKAKRRILMLDDEPQMIETLRFILEDAGYEVDGFTNSKDALFAYHQTRKEKKYDLMILDIILPGKSGLEILKEIRHQEKAEGISPEDRFPVLMLSGLKDSWTQDAFLDGCSDYVIKPVEMDFLLKKVESLIGRFS